MPLEGRPDDLLVVNPVEGDEPDGEVEARPPALDGHDADVLAGEEAALHGMPETEGLLHVVVLQAAGILKR